MDQAQKNQWIETEIQKLDKSDDLSVLAYGEETQDTLSRFSKMFAEFMQNIDPQGSEDLIETIINKIDENETYTKGIAFKLLKEKNKRRYYNELVSDMNQIALQLQLNQASMIKNVTALTQLKEYIADCIEDFNMLISYGQKYISNTSDRADSNEAGDKWQERFKKRLDDLQYSRIIAEQGSAQVQLMIDNGEKIIEQIRQTVVNAIPMWRNQVAVAAGLSSMRGTLEAENDVAGVLKHSAKTSTKSAKIDSEMIRKYDEQLEGQLIAVRTTADQLKKQIHEA